MNKNATPRSSPRILIVENELIVSADIAARLRRLGYDVCGEADCSEDAIRFVAEESPDLVLMDIRLQGEVDGIAAAEQIRQRFRVPIVYLTAHTDEATLQRAKITGPFGYILKPFDERELRTAIEIGLYKFQLDCKLADSEQYLASTLANIGDAVIATDADGRISLLNKVAQQLTGWSNEQALNKPLLDVFCIHTAEKEPQRDLLSTIQLTGLVVSSDNPLLLTSKSGQVFEIEVRATPILDTRSLSCGSVVVFRDVTKMRQQEVERRLAQRMDALGRLASGISHDFNNILTIILAHSDALTQLVPPHSPQLDLATDIAAACRRASELTNQLLAFGRKQSIQQVPTDLNHVVRHACKLLSRVLPKSIELEISLCEEPATIQADESMMEQVIINLALNARDAMPNGGVLRMQTSLESNQGGILDGNANRIFTKLVVSDTGLGMDEVTQSLVWEPFFSTKSKGKGTGLGLANVYSTVQQFGGHVSVKSQLGQGTEFLFYFPMTTNVVDKAECMIPATKGPLSDKKETILVVEDDHQVRNILEQILNVSGYNVLVAMDGDEALEWIRTKGEQIDLLLTDVLMPRMDGPTLAFQVAIQRPEIVTVFLTGYSGKDGLLSTLPNGKTPY